MEEDVHTKLSYWSGKISASVATQTLTDFHRALVALVQMPDGIIGDLTLE